MFGALGASFCMFLLPTSLLFMDEPEGPLMNVKVAVLRGECSSYDPRTNISYFAASVLSGLILIDDQRWISSLSGCFHEA